MGDWLLALIAEQLGSHTQGFQLVLLDHNLERLNLPLLSADPNQETWKAILQYAVASQKL